MHLEDHRVFTLDLLKRNDVKIKIKKTYLKHTPLRHNNMELILPFYCVGMVEGLDWGGGSGIHYSLKMQPIIHLTKTSLK